MASCGTTELTCAHTEEMDQNGYQYNSIQCALNRQAMTMRAVEISDQTQ